MTDARDDLVARVTRRLEVVHERIAATGRDPASLRLVAVVKGFGPEVAAACVAAGLAELGENYAAGLVASHDALAVDPDLGHDAARHDATHHDAAHHGAANHDVTWHFLGALQRNKLARLATRVDCYQTVASASDAAAIAARAPGASCYVQVDVTGAPGRAGCDPARTPEVVAAARDAGLSVEGLMCVAAPEPAAAAAQFAGLRRAADALSLEGCSMGMSGDLELACSAGATMLRLGTALLGPRPSRGSPRVA